MLVQLFISIATVLASSSATNPRAKLLTMEEAVGRFSSDVIPEKVQLYWDPAGQLTKQLSPKSTQEWKLPISTDPFISYGQAVSRNEFGIDTTCIPSPDGRLLAVYRKDESAVGRFKLFKIRELEDPMSPTISSSIPYPMAGTASEKLQLCICDNDGNIVSTLQVNDFDEERYLTAVSWSPDSKYVFVQVLDRPQHNMRLNMYRASDGSFVRTLLSESNEAWVESQEPLHWFKGTYKFIYTTNNRDGFRQLYLCDTLGRVNRITPCAADVDYLANDGKYIYYTSAEISPIENHLFRIRVGARSFGRPQQLTSEPGWHEIDMSPDCSKFIDRYSSLNVPGVTQIKTCDGQVMDHILTALDPLDEYAKCRVDLGSVRSADGKHDNYYRLYYPRDYDPSRSYPLIVYVYGGPIVQLVRNSWLANIRMWEMLMAQKGYFVYVQDNRGTPRHGTEYEKAINRQCGKAESEDQMAGIHELLARFPEIDRNRIGVHGWSYGGFLALTLACDNPNFFKTTVVGGPVIDWRWYEVMYGERYMDSPQTNPEGYRSTSLLHKADKLTGRVMIYQGTADDVVLWQHSLSFVQKCIEAQKPVDYFTYPLEGHNMKGAARVHLYNDITDYFDTYL